jgi:hypothetical protein
MNRRIPFASLTPLALAVSIGWAAVHALAEEAATNAPAAVASTVAPAATNGSPIASPESTAAFPPSSASPHTNTPSRSDYAYFRVVNDRNIFNPKRVPNRPDRPGRSTREPRRTPKIDSFSLVGSLRYSKGDIAFFDGTSASYKTAVKTGESIAGHKVVAIATDRVTIEIAGKTVELAIGSQLRREDDGDWKTTDGIASTASKPASITTDSDEGDEESTGSTSTAASTGSPADEVLKRLLQRREQELKK